MAIPKSNKLHIGIFGRTNSGKSTLFNLLAGERVAIVSEIAGTTTDAVYKATEMSELGAVVLVDTAGFDDNTDLADERIRATMSVLDSVDVAILVAREHESTESEAEWVQFFNDKRLPFIKVHNVNDDCMESGVCRTLGEGIIVNCKTGSGKDKLISKLLTIKPERDNSLIKDLVSSGDTVVLVMPQDTAAPNGRLILPESMMIRELVDKGCISINCDVATLPEVVSRYGESISLVITDSCVFAEVEQIAKGIRLTSFSVLYAGLKGDIDVLVSGASAIEQLTGSSRVLIVEACSHITTHEDIGRVKIPRLLRSKAGQGLTIDFIRTTGSMNDITSYDLIVHCGGCMMTRRAMQSRLMVAKEQGVAITNYGVVIAYLTGVLDKIVY